MHAPTLTSRRLELRPLADADRQPLAALFNHAEVGRYLWDGRAVTPEETAGVIADSTASFRDHGWGLWGIRRRSASALIGFCGYRSFHQPPVVELMFGLHPSAWGQGLAREAAEAAIADARGRLGFAAIHASTDPPNRRSAALLARLGFRLVAQRSNDGLATDHYRLDAPDAGAGGAVAG